MNKIIEISKLYKAMITHEIVQNKTSKIFYEFKCANCGLYMSKLFLDDLYLRKLDIFINNSIDESGYIKCNDIIIEDIIA